MTGFINKVKEAISGGHHENKTEATHTSSASKPQEQQFSIQPHPATTNDPADLQPFRDGKVDAFHAHEPYVPSDNIKSNMPAPLSREELQERQAALRSEVPGHGTQQGNLL
ncbi:hypothetical protein D9619_010393 [Psilocybe cf. subviscida]|uniref:Uncharacterized protein n=1 Tax=Psilocybe cf. subviscida TaxID=2480587 RepID=A0A8H5AU06_9AGAR|nr:hypothetical protein D9619_010393 [Psilocybe cf. subviscida]